MRDSGNTYTEFPGDEIVAVHFKKEPKPPDGELPEPEPVTVCGITQVNMSVGAAVSGFPDWHWSYLGNFSPNYVYFYNPLYVPEEDRVEALPNMWFLHGVVSYTIESNVITETLHSNPDGVPVYTITVPLQTGIQETWADRPGLVGTPGIQPADGTPPLVTGPPDTYEVKLDDYIEKTIWSAARYDFMVNDIHQYPAPPQGYDYNPTVIAAGSYVKITAYCVDDGSHSERSVTIPVNVPIVPMRWRPR